MRCLDGGQVLSYRLGNIPADAPQWLVAELLKLQQALNGPVDSAEFNTLHVAPKKLKEGLVALADGTDWKPNGIGVAGLYQYRSGTWVLLG